LVAEAVRCEPVSTGKFLLTGKKQGKTRKQAGPSKPKLKQICNINDLPDIPLIARTGIITGATRES
jgi:hypothetical protein